MMISEKQIDMGEQEDAIQEMFKWRYTGTSKKPDEWVRLLIKYELVQNEYYDYDNSFGFL